MTSERDVLPDLDTPQGRRAFDLHARLRQWLMHAALREDDAVVLAALSYELGCRAAAATARQSDAQVRALLLACCRQLAVHVQAYRIGRRRGPGGEDGSALAPQ